MDAPLVAPDRTEPALDAAERPMLEGWLDYHRATLLVKCAGLDAAGLRTRPVASSLMSLHGLVRHMAEVERGWFRRGLAGEADAGPIWYSADRPDGDFDVGPGDDFASDLAAWRAEVDAARAIAARHGLDDMSRGRGGRHSLRWILTHMIEEYARHNGHADLIREMIDGTVGD